MQNLKELKLRILIKEILKNELTESFDFDKIIPYEFKIISNEEYSFNLDPKNKITTLFENFQFEPDELEHIKSLNDNGIWAKLPWNESSAYNVEFNIGGETNKAFTTSITIYYRIIKTVFLIVKEFINKNNPEMLFIGSSNDKKQHQFNATIIAHITELPNWSFEQSKFGTALFKQK